MDRRLQEQRSQHKAVCSVQTPQRALCRHPEALSGNKIPTQGFDETGTFASERRCTENFKSPGIRNAWVSPGNCMRRMAKPLQLLRSAAAFCLIALCGFTTPTLAAEVIEFYNANLDNYFITADSNEAAAIDGGSAGPGWSRTGSTFASGGSTARCWPEIAPALTTQLHSGRTCR